MAHQDRLLYFEIRGRAEAIRMIYAVAGKSFIDERISQKDDWPSRKADQPLGTLPVLTTEEGTLCQSNVIARYVAKKLGLMGSSLWEEALHDMVIETAAEIFEQIVEKVMPWKLLKIAPEPEEPEKVLEEVKTHMMKRFAYIQSIAEKQGKRFIVSDEIGLADLWVYSGMDVLEALYPGIGQSTTWMKDFISRVESNENLKKYLASRPSL